MNRFLLYIFTMFALLSCKRHSYTTKVCGHLYMEVFNVNPAGVDQVSITDSLKFRITMEDFDNEHENYSCDCIDDSVFIYRLERIGGDSTMTVVEKKRYKIKQLEKDYPYR